MPEASREQDWPEVRGAGSGAGAQAGQPCGPHTHTRAALLPPRPSGSRAAERPGERAGRPAGGAAKQKQKALVDNEQLRHELAQLRRRPGGGRAEPGAARGGRHVGRASVGQMGSCLELGRSWPRPLPSPQRRPAYRGSLSNKLKEKHSEAYQHTHAELPSGKAGPLHGGRRGAPARWSLPNQTLRSICRTRTQPSS